MPRIIKSKPNGCIMQYMKGGGWCPVAPVHISGDANGMDRTTVEVPTITCEVEYTDEMKEAFGKMIAEYLEEQNDT